DAGDDVAPLVPDGDPAQVADPHGVAALERHHALGGLRRGGARSGGAHEAFATAVAADAARHAGALGAHPRADFRGPRGALLAAPLLELDPPLLREAAPPPHRGHARNVLELALDLLVGDAAEAVEVRFAGVEEGDPQDGVEGGVVAEDERALDALR